MWFATMAAFHKSLRSWKWAILTGFIWGLALATKLNSFFIPAVLVVLGVLGFAVRRGRRRSPVRGDDHELRVPESVTPLAAVVILAVLSGYTAGYVREGATFGRWQGVRQLPFRCLLFQARTAAGRKQGKRRGDKKRP